MHMRIKTLSLNDSRPSSPHNSIVPNSQEVADDIILLWKEEPQAEGLKASDLFQKLQIRHPEWNINLIHFETILLDQNLISNESHKLNLYNDEVDFPSLNNDSFYQLSKNKKCEQNIELASDKSGRGIYSKENFDRGDLVLHELSPICIIPPMDKLTLMKLGKSCSLCGKSISSSNISPHFIMMNGLDCNDCDSIWCSKNCKKKHSQIHSALKHNKYKFQKEVNTKSWNEFELYCQEKVFVAAYSVAVIMANILIDNNLHLKEKFNMLASVSQETRIKSSDTTNIGGTFDVFSGARNIEDPEIIWKETYKLFIRVFPILLEQEHPVDYQTFLSYIGRFNINQISQQLYFVASFLNHNCEPNTHYEIDSKYELKLSARKPIKEGDELLITYINPLHEVILRRRELRVNYGFQCNCKRCQVEARAPKVIIGSDENTTTPISESPSSDLDNGRRKSSMRSKRPDLAELLKNGQEFDLEVPETLLNGHRRRTSVRFDGNVSMAVEEE